MGVLEVAALVLGLGLLRFCHFFSQTQRSHVGPDFLDVGQIPHLRTAFTRILPRALFFLCNKDVKFLVGREELSKRRILGTPIVLLVRARRLRRFQNARIVRSPDESPQAIRNAIVQETAAGQEAAVLDRQQRRSITSENAPSSG